MAKSLIVNTKHLCLYIINKDCSLNVLINTLRTNFTKNDSFFSLINCCIELFYVKKDKNTVSNISNNINTGFVFLAGKIKR